jgi:hypothetical protein
MQVERQKTYGGALNNHRDKAMVLVQSGTPGEYLRMIQKYLKCPMSFYNCLTYLTLKRSFINQIILILMKKSKAESQFLHIGDIGHLVKLLE